MAFLLQQHTEVEGLFIDYGQRAAPLEKAACEQLASRYGWRVEYADFRAGRSFANGEIVGRNAFLVFAALLLTGGTTDLIALGLHSGTPYYDCSEAFVRSVGELVREHTDGGVNVVVPFGSWTKSDIFKFFCDGGLDVELTYSCESGIPRGCGACLSCLDRQGLRCSPKDVR